MQRAGISPAVGQAVTFSRLHDYAWGVNVLLRMPLILAHDSQALAAAVLWLCAVIE